MDDIYFVIGQCHDGFKISAQRDGVVIAEVFADQESCQAFVLGDFLTELGFSVEVEEIY